MRKVALTKLFGHFGDFLIIKELGNGSFSTVYLVRREKDNKLYAIKKIKLGNLT